MTTTEKLEGTGASLTYSGTELDCDRVEALRQILTCQQHRQVSYDEAQDIGDSLVEFYQVLAEEVLDDSTN